MCWCAANTSLQKWPNLSWTRQLVEKVYYRTTAIHDVFTTLARVHIKHYVQNNRLVLLCLPLSTHGYSVFTSTNQYGTKVIGRIKYDKIKFIPHSINWWYSGNFFLFDVFFRIVFSAFLIRQINKSKTKSE